jgi:hypothetical protein
MLHVIHCTNQRFGYGNVPEVTVRGHIQGWKKKASKRALLAGNVKQLQEICLNEDFLMKI